MQNLTLKEKLTFGFIFNEKRVYHRWYGRFFVFKMDFERLKRVVARVKNWYAWCMEWAREGEHLEKLADEAAANGNNTLAIGLFHESVACFHIGQHIFFIDEEQKEKAQARARTCYEKAISLYPEETRPIRIEIPFRGSVIPGYLRLAPAPGQPLVIYLNGMDNIKEAENHFFGSAISGAGLNFFCFDGPGQGEMRQSMKFMLDYEKVVSAVIDWFEKNNKYTINLKKIATVGFSLGGYLAPLAAAHDRRICCTVGNSGFAAIGGVRGAKKLNPIWQRGINYMTGCEDFEEAVKNFDLDITRAPRLDRPLLFFHAGKDEVMPSPKKQADTFMDWAVGEKELRFYPHGEHCTVNYLDEVFPYIIDWLKKHLLA
ncbi:MAG: alpha/beta hydrolase [bacterium]|nr:alpha/beta hydrolase [bacterium]